MDSDCGIAFIRMKLGWLELGVLGQKVYGGLLGTILLTKRI